MGLFCLKLMEWKVATSQASKPDWVTQLLILIETKNWLYKKFSSWKTFVIFQRNKESLSQNFALLSVGKAMLFHCLRVKLIRESTVSFPFSGKIRKKKSTPQIEEKTWQCFLSGRLVTFFKRFKFVSIRDNK